MVTNSIRNNSHTHMKITMYVAFVEEDAECYDNYGYEDYEVNEDYSDVENDRQRWKTSVELTANATRDGDKVEEQRILLINGQDESKEHI